MIAPNNGTAETRPGERMVAMKLDLNRGAAELLNSLDTLGVIGDLFTIDGDDYVAGNDPSLLGGAARMNILHQNV